VTHARAPAGQGFEKVADYAPPRATEHGDRGTPGDTGRRESITTA